MKRVVGIAWVLCGLVLLMMGLVAVAVATLDLSRHKDWITNKFTEGTGVRMVLHGDIKHSIYPFLGVELDGVTIGNPQGFSGELLTSGPIEVRVRLSSLLSDHLEFDVVGLRSAQLHLIRNEQGVGNWELLRGNVEVDMEGDTASESVHSNAEAPRVLPARTISISSIDIEDVELIWQDMTTGQSWTLNDIHVMGEGSTQNGVIDVNGRALLSASHNDVSIPVRLTAKNVSDADGDAGSGGLSFTLEGSFAHADLPADQETASLRAVLNWQGSSIQLQDVHAEALGGTLTGQLRLTDTDGPLAVEAELNIQGEDIALPFQVARIEPLAGMLTKQPHRAYLARLRLQSDAETFALETLRIALLGARIEAENVFGDIGNRAFGGTLHVNGPDLPLLLSMATAHLPKDGDWFARIEALHNLPEKEFSIDAQFDVDVQEERIELPVLQANILGVQLAGQVSSIGRLQGQIDLRGEEPDTLLRALQQDALADALQAFHLSLGLAGTAEKLEIESLSLQADLRPGYLGTNSPAALTVQGTGMMDTLQEQLTVERFSIAAPGLDMSGSFSIYDYGDAPRYEGSLSSSPLDLRALMETLQQPLPESADPSTLRQVALNEFKLKGDMNTIDVSSMQVRLDDSSITGTLAAKGLAATPEYTLQLSVDQIDLDRYLPPESKATEENLQDDAAGPQDVRLDVMDDVYLSAGLSVEALTLRNLQLQSLLVKARVEDGLAQIAPFRATLYEGQYEGKIEIDARGAVPGVTFTSVVNAVQVGPLLQDFLGMESPPLKGQGMFDLQLQATGAGVDPLLASVSGNGSLALQEGAFTGFDIAGILLQVENLIKKKRLAKVDIGDQTQFTQASATLDIEEGVIRNDDLLLQAPGFQLTGTGVLAELEEATWDYRMVVATDAKAINQGMARYDLGGHTLAIQCTGKIESKRCLPDVQTLLTQVLGKKILGAASDKIGDTVKDLLPGSSVLSGATGGALEALGGAVLGDDEAVQDEGDSTNETEVQPSQKEQLIDDLLDKLL